MRELDFLGVGRGSLSQALYGEHVYLRPLQKRDAEEFVSWFADIEVIRFLGMEPLTQDKATMWFNELLRDSTGQYFGIVKKNDKKLIGYTFLTGISERHKIAKEFGIVMGDKEEWGKGYGTEATRLMLEYGFNVLKLHRIQLLVLDFNRRALRMYRKLGFKREGIQREARVVNDEWHDVIMMSMLEKEFQRKLDKKNRNIYRSSRVNSQV